jgi:predicted cupin superfamily sugar epimerase
MHGMENVKNDVMSHKTFNFNKQCCENMESSIYLLLDKEKSSKWKKWSKAAHVLKLGTTLESMRTLYLHLDSRKECFLRG